MRARCPISASAGSKRPRSNWQNPTNQAEGRSRTGECGERGKSRIMSGTAKLDESIANSRAASALRTKNDTRRNRGEGKTNINRPAVAKTAKKLKKHANHQNSARTPANRANKL